MRRPSGNRQSHESRWLVARPFWSAKQNCASVLRHKPYRDDRARHLVLCGAAAADGHVTVLRATRAVLGDAATVCGKARAGQ